MHRLLVPISLARLSLRLHRTRSLLTILGVFIGVASVVTIFSLGEGVKNYFAREMAGYGSDSVYIVPETMAQIGQPGRIPQPFSNDELQALRKYATTIHGLEPGVMATGVAKYGEKSFAGFLYGGDIGILNIEAMELTAGRMFTTAEVTARERVAVMGRKVREELFAEWEDPLGQTVRFNGQPFKIIGVTSTKGSLNAQEGSNDTCLFTPYTTVQDRFLGSDKVMYFAAKMNPGIDKDAVVRDLSPILRAERRITDPTKDDFAFLVLNDFLEFTNTFFNILVAVFGGIAGLALVVGGVGLMNIMLVAVAERTREIGLRKAVGAPNASILVQFLSEAIMLTGAGGIAGLLGGWGLGVAVSPFLEKAFGEGIHPVVPWVHALVTVAIVMVVGILFGTYPAWKASKMDPIRALGYH